MERKESYRQNLPHFQQPGQAYFVTWSLNDAVPPKALVRYTNQLKSLTCLIEDMQKQQKDVSELKQEYAQVRKQYAKAFDDLLHVQTKFPMDLSRTELTEIVLSALKYWHGIRVENYAICVMKNHVHWVFRLFEKDENNKSVYLQDILQSVKRFSSNKLNEVENRKGTIWQKESWDTTIRDDRHLYNAVKYTIYNPVEAGYVENWWEWKGTWVNEEFVQCFM